ncbi:MAG: DCC1-like thiol-disulfide oxidoreductase family protein [Chitinophagaceae bacterium]|nr:DCC1-like thiol-disulfide oxidoreductase family protein [Chitinophagaceae bacterium]
MVNFAIRNDPKARLKFTPLQSEAGKKILASFDIQEMPDSVALVEGDKITFVSTAAIRITKYLRFPARLLYALIIIPKFIRDPFYKWVGKNRYKWFGKKKAV